MVVGGIVLLLLALAMLYWRRLAQQKVADLLSVDVEPIGDLLREIEAVAAQIGGGSYQRYVCVQGVVVADDPVQAPVSEVRCALYDHSIRRVYEEIEERTDEDGSVRRHAERRTETMSRERRAAEPIFAADSSGKIALDLEDASLDLETTADRFEPARSSGASIRVGSLKLEAFDARPGRTTLGYEIHERVLPLGKRITVVGELSDESGAPAIRRPRDRRSYQVSFKGRTELLGTTRRTIKVAAALALLFALAGLGVILAHFVS